MHYYGTSPCTTALHPIPASWNYIRKPKILETSLSASFVWTWLLAASVTVLMCGGALAHEVHTAAAASSMGNVSYDHRALVIGGVRRVLISGCVHYPRSTPEMWPDIIAKAKAGGLNVIQSYVFWNLHEPNRGTYNFEGRLDLVRFIKTVQSHGLFMNLRIGPYACAEWNYGGFPVWMHFIDGIAFRTDNEPFKAEMQRFTAMVVEMMRREELFYWQGGPIILTQIENEYGNVASSYGAPGKAYTKWAAQMAVGLNTGVPWIMCQQSDAPDPVINTCNGFYCDSFTPNSANKPKMWTENWSGWFQSFGGRKPYRPVQDVAFATARFYERGGTFQSYYMYHGGTNFGRTSGGPFISTSYDYDAPIDEYGNLNQPKWGHLKDLHHAIQLCEPALILGDPTPVVFGSNQEGHVYTDGNICAAFLANYDDKADATVTFREQSYHLPAWSVSILPDCKNVIYNTAQINAQTSILTTSQQPHLQLSNEAGNSPSFLETVWQTWEEPIGDRGENSFKSNILLEQINTTKDATDYLWYSTSVELNDSDLPTNGNGETILSLSSKGHAVHVFVNKKLSGSGFGNSGKSTFDLQVPVKLNSGINTIDLLSMTVGLQNYGAFFDTWGAGIHGNVVINGLNGASKNISSYMWTYQIGLKGEALRIYEKSIDWNTTSDIAQGQPMIWYKTNFIAPEGNGSIALDLTSMGKGVAWINGKSIGRYWPAYISTATGCSSTCPYQGRYSASKCYSNCGQPSQSRYHVPRSWIQESGNTLVLFEEIGGDPSKISFVTSLVSSVCAHVAEIHAPPIDKFVIDTLSQGKAEARIDCGEGRVISNITFASYGNPQGICDSFTQGTCHASNSMYIVKKACIGRQSCSVMVTNENFKQDPCKKAIKSLAVQAACS